MDCLRSVKRTCERANHPPPAPVADGGIVGRNETMTPAEQQTTLDQIHESLRVLAQRLPLVDDYWLDLEEAADILAALVESTE